MPTTSGSAPPAPGIFDSIRSFLATWVGLIKTRVELLSLEVEEQREWLEYVVVWGLAALFCIGLGLVLLTLFIVVCFWDTYRLWVLGGFALLYLGGGGALVLLLRKKMKHRPRMFETTAAELAKDHSYLRPGTP
jgi:uncharacterized membrane protein YqjE